MGQGQDRIHAQVPGSSFRPRRASFTDAHLNRSRRLVYDPPLAVRCGPAQSIQVRHRDARQPLVTLLAKIVKLSLQNLLRRRSTERLVGLIHLRQQCGVGRRVQGWEAPPPIRLGLHWLALQVLGDQACHLCSAQARHFSEVAPNHPAARPAQFAVVLLAQCFIHPAVDLLSVLALEMNFIAAFQKCSDLLQAQPLFALHADYQIPACRIAPPGSSCMRNSQLPRLILYEMRLRLSFYVRMWSYGQST